MDLLSSALTSGEEQARAAAELIAPAPDGGRDVPRFWDPGIGEERYIPVEDAEIRVLHIRPPNPQAVRPIVLAPGWGVIPEGFQSFYEAVHGKAELFYLETREKASSRILNPRADMSVSRSARDIQAALEALGLAGRRDFVLIGACWSGAIILRGLLEGVLKAPTVIAADPMHAIWFPRWVLRHISPLLPTAAARMLRPILLQAMVGDMKEPAQKRRVYAFVWGADIWKWKKSAEAAHDFELFGTLAGVREEVFVLNGTRDKVHDQSNYPRIARELARGRFLYVPTDESLRERMFGAVALEFAGVTAGQGLPPRLSLHEKTIR